MSRFSKNLTAALSTCLVVAQLHAVELVSFYPANGQANVPPSTAVTFTFDVPMNTDVGEPFFLSFGIPPQAIVGVTATWSGDARTLTCTRAGGWPANTQIYWSVASDFEDTTGDFFLGASGLFTTGSGSGGGDTGWGTNAYTAFVVSIGHQYVQAGTGATTLDPDSAYVFSGAVTLASNRTAVSISLTPPVGGTLPLTQNFLARENWYYLDLYTNLTDFNSTYTPGIHSFLVSAASSNQTVQVNLPASLLQPNAPTVANMSAAQAVNAGADFVLSWSPFEGGTASDFISFSIEDLYQSPDLGQPQALNGTTTSATVPAGTLQPNQTYEASLGFWRANISTNAAGYTTSAARVTLTKFDIKTRSGTASIPPVLGQPSLISGGRVVIPFQVPAGQPVELKKSTEVTGGTWETALSTLGTGAMQHYTNSPSSGQERLFFRAESP